MALSKVEICNRALVFLGQAGVLNIGQEGNDARACELQYDPCVRSMLEQSNWTFATARRRLSQLDEEPPFEFLYTYALPSDLIRLQTVYFDTLPVLDERWYTVEDGKLLCDQVQDVFVKYTFLQTDPKRFSELFSEAVALRIAAKVCYFLVESSTIYGHVSVAADRALIEAKAFDSQNQSKNLQNNSYAIAYKY